MILVGDIGGTKTLLGLAQEGKLVLDRRLANADFQDFPSLLASFLAETQTDPALIRGGCLAVAGPVADDGRSARLTNLPWTIDSAALAHGFGLPALRLANDFAAAALGAVTASRAMSVLGPSKQVVCTHYVITRYGRDCAGLRPHTVASTPRPCVNSVFALAQAMNLQF